MYSNAAKESNQKQINTKNSLFITVFQKGKYINEKKYRVMVKQIENFTKPLYRVFPEDCSFNFIS